MHHAVTEYTSFIETSSIAEEYLTLKIGKKNRHAVASMTR